MNKKEQFDKYYDLLCEWNAKMNLTTITEREKVELFHFKDSILIEDKIPTGSKVIDIGSGAGFPGIPLKIMRDDLDVTLIDSTNKKVGFMNTVIEALQLTGIRAIHTRIEDYKDREKFDVAVSRAVAPLNTLTEYCLPFVKKGGLFIAYKTANEEERREAERAIELLGGTYETEKREYEYNGERVEREFVIVKKIKNSPVGYPRGGNKPRLKPIV